MKKKILPKKKVFALKVKPKVSVKAININRKKKGGILSSAIIGIHNLAVPFGAHKPRKILGRGSGSGHGKTSTRGSKGQTSRSGRDFYLGFEGGQSPLIRKIPKRGFTSNFRKEYQIVNLDSLKKIKETSINPESLKKNGLIKDKDKPVKILSNGEIKNPISFQVHAVSRKALEKITQVGGKVEIINA